MFTRVLKGFILFVLVVVFTTVLTVASIVVWPLPCAKGAEPPVVKEQRDRDARAQIELARPDPAKCACPPGRTAADRLAKWGDAVKAKDKVVVVFAGCEPRCCSDALPVKMSAAEASPATPSPPKAVYVYARQGGTLRCVKVLPETATPQQVREAVEAARKLAD